MIKKLIIYLYFALFFSLVAHASEENYVSVNVYNEIYWGTLSVDDSAEDNTVLFTTVPDSHKQFTISGKFKNNTFNKNCTITYADGTIQSVTYKNGLISGKVTSTNPDGTYQNFSCSSGNPYGTLSTYSNNDVLIDIDWFYQCTPIKELLNNTIAVEYNLLFSNLYDYINLPIKVDGVVEEIYETSSRSLIKVSDDNNNIYLFGYQNPNTYKYSVAQIETPSVGDSVTLVGLVTQIQDDDNQPLILYEHSLGYQLEGSKIKLSLENKEIIQALKDISTIADSDLEREFPVFDTIYCKILDSTVDPLALQYTYEEICTCPLYYKGKEYSFTGSVIDETIDLTDNLVTFIVQLEHSQDIYKIKYKLDEDSNITSNTSFLNQEISCTGVFDELSKELYFTDTTKTCGYVLLPTISVSELTIN